MIIIETSDFTKIIKELIPDELYAEFQAILVKNPKIGDLIQGSTGLRKVRWRLPNKGKSSGIRIIYYWFTKRNVILMLYAYAKNNQIDLTKRQIKILKQVVAEEFENGK